MQFNIRFKISKGYDSLSSDIKNIQRAFSKNNQKSILRFTGMRFLEMVKSTFGQNETYRGNKWQELSKNYAKKVGSKTPTLLRSGKLKNSIKMKSNGDKITIYSENPYSRAHFLGNPKNNLPARRWAPLENVGVSSWRLTLQAHRELFNVLSRQLSIYSGNSLPRQNLPDQMPKYEQGNPAISGN